MPQMRNDAHETYYLYLSELILLIMPYSDVHGLSMYTASVFTGASFIFNYCFMTLLEFEALNEDQKKGVIGEATFLSYREEAAITIVLYKVFDFYLQVYYSNEDNAILGFHAISEVMERRVPYGYSLS
jgi:hypothetical protein